MQDNAFLEISDIETAQKLSDRINPQGLHKVLDVFARRYSPVPESLGLGYTWTVQQIECATDIMFRKPEYLAPIYDEIIHTAIYTVKPDNIATFLGQRITYNCTKEIGTNYNQRILGTRIKHHMGDVSIKMYDKFGCVLRITDILNLSHPLMITAAAGRNWMKSVIPGGKRNEPIADSTFLILVICLYWKPSAKGNT